jgi:UDP-N-acetyl-D-galactosamine dehydrogenase
MILRARAINDFLPEFTAQCIRDRLVQAGVVLNQAKVGCLGITYKPDVPDIRGSRVLSLLHHLEVFGITPLVHDPVAVQRRIYSPLVPWDELKSLDALILAVPHNAFRNLDWMHLTETVKPRGTIFDLGFSLELADFGNCNYWRL